MSRRLTLRPLRPLRLAVLTGVAAGALLVPASAAFAADPTPTPGATDLTPEEKEVLEKKKAEDARAAEAAKAGKDYPRGGVAAGEAPAGDSTSTLVGSATGALLLAGAGTYVLRRRTTARRDG
ncbi:sortase-dependent protein [Streptomyces sp. ADMS]|uniref:sortase-dependent protein n=1 Tax=Streptomyces sp. ADMS TaxID=3071415 RepID=UPI00296F30BD|nr:sortase-dependent protein [Streptomyces sp. ADMS]MDW4908155.1 sortase-dependent protein [Streptomyces sp. ADMS]